jgi:hypothetical protein
MMGDGGAASWLLLLSINDDAVGAGIDNEAGAFT